MIVKLYDFKISDMVLYDLYDESEDIVKIDISMNTNQAAIMIQFEELPVLGVSENHIMLSLKDKEHIKTFFNDLDTYIVNIIQEKKITKKLKTKFNYRQLISGDILNLNLNFDENKDFVTQIYQSSNVQLSSSDMTNLLKNNGRAQLLLELKSINFNKKEGIIFLDNIIRQMKVKKLKPKRIDNIKYSFVDSINESDVESTTEIKDNNNEDNKSCDDDCLINNKNDNETSDDDLILQSDNDDDVDDDDDEDSDEKNNDSIDEFIKRY